MMPPLLEDMIKSLPLTRKNTVSLLVSDSFSSFRVKTPGPGENSRAPGPGAYDQTSRVGNVASPSYK